MTSPILRAVLLACLLSLALAGVAAAHAELVESTPADGATIQTPTTVSATFSEELVAGNSRIVVRAAAGTEVARGDVADDDPTTLTAELPELPGGEYVARWTAVGDDGHVVRGAFSFSVVAEPTPAPATPSPSPARTSPPASTSPTDEAPTPSPAASPSPTLSPSPSPDEGAPTAGATDVILALVLAGAVVGGLALYLLRRR